MANWGEDVDYEAMELKDHEGRFTINFKKIFVDVDEISQRTLEVTDKHPKDSLLKLWAGTMIALFIIFVLAYQVLIFIAIPFFIFYIIALFRIYSCWKGFRYSKSRFWLMTIPTLTISFCIAQLIQHFVLNNLK
jgi:hypothetical protein